ncbi:MAG: PorT family protein [Fibrobacteraceae bacterium]|nr:PorT family protein [Fibrobacteraceae bacterium]
MNLKICASIAVLALSASVFAEETVQASTAAQTPAAEQAPSAAAPAENAAPAVEEEAPVAEVAPQAVQQSNAPAAEASPAPDAVEPAPAAAPAAKETIYFYNTTTAAPTPVRQSSATIHTTYVSQNPAPDTLDLGELRGYIPVGPTFGVQGFLGSYFLSSDYDDDFYGFSWRAGVFGIFPLTKYTCGLKIAALFEQSDASATFDYNRTRTNFKYMQRKLDIPLLFTFKGSRSRLSFDMGAQAAVALTDELKVVYKDSEGQHKSKIDLLDDEYRRSMEWELVFGFSVRAHKYLGFDLRANLGLSDLYDGFIDDFELAGRSASVEMGLSFFLM